MRIEKAVKRYGTKTALNVEGIEFPRGQICAVMGVNGCGKTTLARVLAGTTRPDEGGMILDAGEAVGYMPQRSYAFYGTLAHNVALGAKGRRFDERCQELVEALGLSHLERESAKKLSGGETARMALARVLAGTWTHLVLDEPTAALDIPSTLAAERLMRDYCTEKNAGIVVVTHSVSQARRLADHAIFMDGGRIVEEGPTADILSHPKTPELSEFLAILGS